MFILEKYIFLLYPKHVIKLSGYNLGCYNSPPIKIISSSKFIPDSKSCGYCAVIVASGSQVAFSLPWCYQITFTNSTCLFRNCFTSRARIAFSFSSYDKSSYTCISCTGSMCDSSERYLQPSTHETHYAIWPTLEGVCSTPFQPELISKSEPISECSFNSFNLPFY